MPPGLRRLQRVHLKNGAVARPFFVNFSLLEIRRRRCKFLCHTRYALALFTNEITPCVRDIFPRRARAHVKYVCADRAAATAAYENYVLFNSRVKQLFLSYSNVFAESKLLPMHTGSREKEEKERTFAADRPRSGICVCVIHFHGVQWNYICSLRATFFFSGGVRFKRGDGENVQFTCRSDFENQYFRPKNYAYTRLRRGSLLTLFC